MADVRKRNPAQPSRLQRRAPASIQISPVSEWNVAIPLLSPLVQSPTKNELMTPPDRLSCKESSSSEKPVVVVMKKWQHPAAPFCYEPAPPLLPFVSVDR